MKIKTKDVNLTPHLFFHQKYHKLQYVHAVNFFFNYLQANMGVHYINN